MAITNADAQDQNRSELPTQTVTNTPWGNLIYKCCATNQKLTLPPFLTQNELYNIMGPESIGVKNGRDFELKYFGIGIRGSDCDGKTSIGTTRLKVNQHQPIDANVFVQIPFLVRPLDNDLDNLTRAKYRMRVPEVLLDGKEYAVYYLKLINFMSYNPSVNRIQRDDAGNEDSNPYVPVKDDLFDPQPVDFTSLNTVPISGTYMNSSAILDCSLDQNDLNECAMACKLKFGDTSYASINETALAFGIDTLFDGKLTSGQTIRYMETLSALFAHYITERDGRSAITNTKVQLAFDHGASEPMLLHTDATATPASQGN